MDLNCEGDRLRYGRMVQEETDNKLYSDKCTKTLSKGIEWLKGLKPILLEDEQMKKSLIDEDGNFKLGGFVTITSNTYKDELYKIEGDTIHTYILNGNEILDVTDTSGYDSNTYTGYTVLTLKESRNIADYVLRRIEEGKHA